MRVENASGLLRLGPEHTLVEVDRLDGGLAGQLDKLREEEEADRLREGLGVLDGETNIGLEAEVRRLSGLEGEEIPLVELDDLLRREEVFRKAPDLVERPERPWSGRELPGN